MLERDAVSFRLFSTLKSSIAIPAEFNLGGPVSQDEESDIQTRQDK